MKKPFNYCLLLMVIVAVSSACSTNLKTQRVSNNGPQKFFKGLLSDSIYNELRIFLAAATNTTIKDTVIIKYDYNMRDCWVIMDQESDTYIESAIHWHRKQMKALMDVRKNVSFLEFREPGDDFNKIKKWDNLIYIDSTKYLHKLLFKQTSICGNSIIILPDKRLVYLKSDPHSDAFRFTANQICEVLTNN